MFFLCATNLTTLCTVIVFKVALLLYPYSHTDLSGATGYSHSNSMLIFFRC